MAKSEPSKLTERVSVLGSTCSPSAKPEFGYAKRPGAPELFRKGPMSEQATFRMGRLDHVHIRVPDRAEAAAWYSTHLGFEPVDSYAFWSNAVDGGPLQISADGGRTMLALFETSKAHPMIAQRTGVAFSVDASAFALFARALPNGIEHPSGRRLVIDDLIDFDLCWAYDLVDPWGNQYELNCYEYEQVKTDLVERDEVSPVRYWPREVYDEHRTRSAHEGAPQR